MLALLSLVPLLTGLVLTGEAGSYEGTNGGEEGAPGTDGFGAGGLDLPVLAYPAIAAGVFVCMLVLVYAFRSVSKRH